MVRSLCVALVVYLHLISLLEAAVPMTVHVSRSSRPSNLNNKTSMEKAIEQINESQKSAKFLFGPNLAVNQVTINESDGGARIKEFNGFMYGGHIGYLNYLTNSIIYRTYIDAYYGKHSLQDKGMRAGFYRVFDFSFLEAGINADLLWLFVGDDDGFSFGIFAGLGVSFVETNFTSTYGRLRDGRRETSNKLSIKGNSALFTTIAGLNISMYTHHSFNLGLKISWLPHSFKFDAPSSTDLEFFPPFIVVNSRVGNISYKQNYHKLYISYSIML